MALAEIQPLVRSQRNRNSLIIGAEVKGVRAAGIGNGLEDKAGVESIRLPGTKGIRRIARIVIRNAVKVLNGFNIPGAERNRLVRRVTGRRVTHHCVGCVINRRRRHFVRIVTAVIPVYAIAIFKRMIKVKGMPDLMHQNVYVV